MKSDPDAGWSVKKGTQGVKEYTYGYKLHLLVDCEYELPMAANINAGNVADVTRASNVLSETRFTDGRFRPQHTMADAGYSSKKLFQLIRGQYRSMPIIDPNPKHKIAVKRAKTTPGFSVLRKLRVSVERVNSRLKGHRSLNDITTRRWRKVTLHCYLSLIAMQASFVR